MLTMGQDGRLCGFIREAFHCGLQPLAPLLSPPGLGAQRLHLVPGRQQRLLRRRSYILLCLHMGSRLFRALSSKRSI